MLIESMTTPKTSSDVSKEKLSQHFVSYKNGVFFTFFDSDAPIVEKTESKQDGKKPEKNKNRVSKGPQEPKKLTLESQVKGRKREGLSKSKNQTDELGSSHADRKKIKPEVKLDISMKKPQGERRSSPTKRLREKQPKLKGEKQAK